MLGQIVSKAGSCEPEESPRVLWQPSHGWPLRLQATTSENTNVLLHSVGYFKKQLTGDEKEELLEIVVTYHRRCVPLIVPMTLINHYVRKYREPYLKRQVYFSLTR
jgi:uncharacterized protein YbgA (DUF1722 family)